jgi:ribosomal protein S18 acetylase RimI-like enzyme
VAIGKLKKELGRKLIAHAKPHAGVHGGKDIGLEVRDKKGRLIGGLVGLTYWGWLHVFELWVHGTYRKKGLGRDLLQRAEALAKERGCQYVHLDTFSFQAPGFYKKLGFKVFGTLGPFPSGHKRYYLFKKIG